MKNWLKLVFCWCCSSLQFSVLYFCFTCFHSVLCPILPVSLDFPFLTTPSVFSNIYLCKFVNQQDLSLFSFHTVTVTNRSCSGPLKYKLHDIAEILLKLALNTNQSINLKYIPFVQNKLFLFLQFYVILENNNQQKSTTLEFCLLLSLAVLII